MFQLCVCARARVPSFAHFSFSLHPHTGLIPVSRFTLPFVSRPRTQLPWHSPPYNGGTNPQLCFQRVTFASHAISGQLANYYKPPITPLRCTAYNGNSVIIRIMQQTLALNQSNPCVVRFMDLTVVNCSFVILHLSLYLKIFHHTNVTLPNQTDTPLQLSTLLQSTD
jgi:hypothetical protein